MRDTEQDICPVGILALETIDAQVKCKKCGYSYHTEKGSGVTESYDKERSASGFSENYVCPTCKSGASRSGAAATADVCKDFNLPVAFAELSRKLGLLMPLHEKPNGIEETVQTMSNHFDPRLKRLHSQDKQIEQLQKIIERLEAARPDEEPRQINADLNGFEMRSRSRNLEIHGVLFNVHENLLQKLKGP